jgi:hypothetical protein
LKIDVTLRPRHVSPRTSRTGFYEGNNGWLRYFVHHLRRRALCNGWRQNRRPKSHYQVRCRENSGRAGQSRNQNGTGGYYDSEWSYHATEGDKALMFDVLYAGREAPPHLTQTMFSVLPADGSKSTRIDGLGDKAIFCPNETGMAMLHVLKGDILITIGIHGLPANAVLDSEKSMATKILANL